MNFEHLQFSAFLRAFTQLKNQSFGFLFGAGCSVSSGVPAAWRCIWDWKKSLYVSYNSANVRISVDSESDRREIQRWCNSQPGYPPEDSENEYVFYAEEAFSDENLRRNYFESLFENATPSVGYALLPLLNQLGPLKSVWTTNFDRLTMTAFAQANIMAHEVSIFDQDSIFEISTRNKFYHVSLHGDYRYSKLKNTEKELYQQESPFVDAMSSYFVDKHLVVMGYSGRDKSLMTALKSVYSRRGAGMLYWIGRTPEPSPKVAELLAEANKHQRKAFYIQGPVFDETISRMVKVAYNDDDDVLRKVRLIENSHCKEHTTKIKFEIPNPASDYSLFASTSLYPISVPNICYVFELAVASDKKWETVKQCIKNKNISAILHEGKTFAIGSYDEIIKSFSGLFSGVLIPTPVSIDLYSENKMLRRLLKNALLIGISNHSSLKIDFKKSILWDSSRHYRINQYVYHAIKIKIEFLKCFGKTQLFLSINPTLYFDCNYPESQKKDLCREFISSLKNFDYKNEILYWENRLFNGGHCRFSLDDSGIFKFVISRNCAYSGIISDLPIRQIPTGFDVKRLCFSGIKIPEPTLLFANNGNMVNCANPMSGLIQNMPYDFISKVLPPEPIDIGVICPANSSPTFEKFLRPLSFGNIPARGKDYYQAYTGFQNVYKTPIHIPSIDSDLWIRCRDNQSDARVLADNIFRALESLVQKSKNCVVLIYFPESWNKLKSFKIGSQDIDFHDYIKSLAAQQNIPTQIIEERTIKSSHSILRCNIYWWLSLAIFVKSGRIPWTLGSLDNQSAYAGIGYCMDNNPNKGHQIIIGCSHLFNCHGEGLKFRLKRIEDTSLCDRKNPYLTEDEAYYFGLNIIDMFKSSMTNMPKRVVIHKRTTFKKQEISGLVRALSPYVQDIDLITIEESSIRMINEICETQGFKPHSYPVFRGTCIPVTDYQALLWTHGTLPSIRQNYWYLVGSKGIPVPLMITRCYGKTDLSIIAAEILSFTKLNWNTFEYHTKLPATIEMSNNAARIGLLLKHCNGYSFDSRLFI